MRKQDAVYMNEATGSIGAYDEWWYINDDGEEVNAVDLDEVVEIEGQDGTWENNRKMGW